MFLRPPARSQDGKDHTYWSLVETLGTPRGPRQRTLCYLGELKGSAQARGLKTLEVFNEQGESEQRKLFPWHLEAPRDDPQVARVRVNRVRWERARQFGGCFLGWELWKRLQLDAFFQGVLDEDAAEVPWSQVAALLAINRLCAPGSELALEERWDPTTALGDLLGIEEGQINDTRLYRCLDRMLPHKTKLEHHLKQRYGELFAEEAYILCRTVGRKEKEKAIGERFSTRWEEALKGLEKTIATGRLKDRHKMERRWGKIQARFAPVNDLYDLGLRDTAEGVRLFWKLKEERKTWRD